jgi:hypothetical protein
MVWFGWALAAGFMGLATLGRKVASLHGLGSASFLDWVGLGATLSGSRLMAR